jgi:hypothetical protein
MRSPFLKASSSLNPFKQNGCMSRVYLPTSRVPQGN